MNNPTVFLNDIRRMFVTRTFQVVLYVAVLTVTTTVALLLDFGFGVRPEFVVLNVTLLTVLLLVVAPLLVVALRRRRAITKTTHERSKQRWELWMPISSVAICIIVITATAFIVNSQIKVSEKLRTSERAYVGVASLKAYFDRGEIVVMLENLGGVEAKKIHMSAGAFLVSDKLNGNQAVFDAGEVNLLPGGFQMTVLLKTQKYTPEEIRAIYNKQYVFYLAGAIRYDHGFGTDITTFAFEYKPPPDEDWIAVNKPIPEMIESQKRKAERLSPGTTNKVAPSPLTSPVVTPTDPKASPTGPVVSPTNPVVSPTDKSSPLPSASPSPQVSHTVKTSPNPGGCRCSCTTSCNGACDFECMGCGVQEAMEVATRCCEQASAAIGPCPDKLEPFSLRLFKPRPLRGVLALIGLEKARVCK
jgi:hypothetical protein